MHTGKNLVLKNEITKLDDAELAVNIQNGRDVDDSITELINRHSGIYVDTVKKHIYPTNKFIDVQEVLNDKNSFIYEVAMAYKPEKSKFSTFLCNHTWWMCKRLWKKKKNNLELPVESDVMEVIQHSEADFTPEKNFDQKSFQAVLDCIGEIKDPVIAEILRLRYCHDRESNSITPYSEISQSVGYSIEWCRKLHNDGIKILKEKTKKVDFLLT